MLPYYSVAVFGVIGAFFTWFLPYDTHGKNLDFSLKQSDVKEDENKNEKSEINEISNKEEGCNLPTINNTFYTFSDNNPGVLEITDESKS